jgi:hypothetical protein
MIAALNLIYFIIMRNMKKTLTIFLVFIIAVFFIGSERPGSDRPNNNQQPLVTFSIQMNANNINTWYRNNGSYNRDPVTTESGFEWPKGSNKKTRYASGLWIGARINGQTRVAVAEYDYEYLSGYIDPVTGTPNGKDDPNYRIYTISSPIVGALGHQ